MDIKDFILIGGGLLIVAVLAHGFWLAYRAKREPYRLDIVRDLVSDDIDDIERLRGELPNGGSRIRSAETRSGDRQASLELDLNSAGEAPDVDLSQNLKHDLDRDDVADNPADTPQEPMISSGVVASNNLNSPIRARAHESQREEPPERTEEQADLLEEAPVARVADIQLVSSDRRNRDTEKESFRERTAKRLAKVREPEPVVEQEIVAEELLVVIVLARKGARFEGEALVNALRKQGLKYGEMNIFHRVDPATKGRNYSVANVVEPGVFDLSDLDALASPGISFFMQLPGPEDASAALDDMLSAAQEVAVDLGGEMRDEQMSVLTGQTKEHMRERIADFTRRKLSKARLTV